MELGCGLEGSDGREEQSPLRQRRISANKEVPVEPLRRGLSLSGLRLLPGWRLGFQRFVSLRNLLNCQPSPASQASRTPKGKVQTASSFARLP